MKRIITGFRAEIVRKCIRANVFLVALAYFKNPLTAIRTMTAVKERRKSVRGPRKLRKFIKSGGRYFFMDNIPGWPSEAFNGYFRAEAIRLKRSEGVGIPLSTVFLSVTSKCPMRCRHCFERTNLSGTEFLSLEDLKAIVRKLKDYGVYHIQFTGGEPLERFDDLISLINYSKKGTDIWLNTSGYGLTIEKAAELKKAGLTGAEISLDHWDESEHNHFRGNDNSFSWAGNAVVNCNRQGILTCLSLCATNRFISDENLRRYVLLAMEWDVSFIRLLEPRETLVYKGDEIFLSPDNLTQLEEFFQNASSPDVINEYPIVTYPYYHQRRSGCMGAGNRYFYIDPRGDIHACPFCRNPAGNAKRDSIETAINNLRSKGCQAYRTNTEGLT